MEQKERLEFYAGNTEAALEKYLPKSDKHYAVLIDAMRYSLLGGGKRIRAALCQEFCRVCGETRMTHCPLPAPWKWCTPIRLYTTICPAWITTT